MCRISRVVFLFSAVLSAQSLSFDLASVPTSAVPQSVVTGDFNGDGKPDLAVTEASSVEILLGNGDGTFRSAHVISVGAPATRIVKADFNLDGKPDLAVSVGNFGHVVVLLGNGDGSFQAPVDVGAQSPGEITSLGVPCLAVGDVNGDGKPDLILGPYGISSFSTITVLLGKGDGTFPQSVGTTINYVVDSPGVVVTDYNGDGRADLFVASTIQGELEQFGLLLGTASGQFTTAFWNTGNTGPIVAADINGNGKPDVVMAIGFGNDGNFLLREYLDGGLTYVTTQVPVPADDFSFSFQSMAFADLNGDGKTDLLVTTSDGDMFPLLGNGDGTFQSSPTFPSAASYIGGTSAINVADDAYNSLAAADFFGAGRPSVIVALAGNSLALLKNGAADPPQVVPAGVVNAATSTAIPAVPGSLMTILGSGLAYGSGTLQSPGDVSSFYVPNRLFGLRVYGNGNRAGLLYASPNQANIQIPWELAGQTQATMTITRNGVSEIVTIPVATYAPGLFAMNQRGTGQAAAIINTGEIAAPAGAFPGSRPIHPGEYLALYGTGLGPLDRMDLGDAVITPPPSYYATNGGPLRNTTTTPLVTVGGVSAMVQFSGFAPYMIGVYQVNILIPANAPTGNAVPIVLSIGGVAANTVTVAIQ